MNAQQNLLELAMAKIAGIELPKAGRRVRLRVDCRPTSQMIAGHLVRHGVSEIVVHEDDVLAFMAQAEDFPAEKPGVWSAVEARYQRALEEHCAKSGETEATFPGSIQGFFREQTGRDEKPLRSVEHLGEVDSLTYEGKASGGLSEAERVLAALLQMAGASSTSELERILRGKVREERENPPAPVAPAPASELPETLADVGVVEARALIPTVDDSELIARWHEAEEATDKPRKTIIAALESRFQQLEGEG